jgi:type II secretory pathway pseudopilin PulG
VVDARDRRGTGDRVSALNTPPTGDVRTRPALRRWGQRALAELEHADVCWALLAVASAVYLPLAMWLTRGVTLFIDGMLIFLGNRGLSPGALLAPLNGHLVLMEKSVFAAGFALFGAGDFVPFRLIEAIGAILAAAVLFEYVRRRVGPPSALAAALLVLFLGSAWEVTIVPDVETNIYSAAFGICALLALDRRDRRGDVLACVLLALSIAAWSLGLAFAVIAAVRIAAEGRWRRRLWLVAVPLLLYLAWFAWVRAYYVDHHADSQNIAAANILLVPNFIADEAAAVAGAVSGLNYDFSSQSTYKPFETILTYGAPLAAAGAAVLAWRLRRRRVHPALWATIAGLLAFWVILALGYGGGRSPTTVRYVYPGAVLVFLVTAEACRGIRIPRAAVVAIFAVALFAISTNLSRLRDGANYLRDFSTTLRGQLTALDIARDRVDPSFTPAYGSAAFALVNAGTYLAAADRNGSPGYTPSELSGQSETVREAADATLVPAERIAPAPVPAGTATRGCRTAGSGGAVELAAPAPGAVVIRTAGSASVGLHRFASAHVSVGNVSAGSPRLLTFPRDRYAGPWHVSARSAFGTVTLCRAAG